MSGAAHDGSMAQALIQEPLGELGIADPADIALAEQAVAASADPVMDPVAGSDAGRSGRRPIAATARPAAYQVEKGRAIRLALKYFGSPVTSSPIQSGLGKDWSSDCNSTSATIKPSLTPKNSSTSQVTSPAGIL